MDAAVATPESIAALEPTLRRFAFRATKDADLAQELAQATLAAALEGARAFEGRSQLRTWLLGVLGHKIVDHLRRVGRDGGEGPEAPDVLAAPDAQGVERVVEARHQRKRVEAALAERAQQTQFEALLRRASLGLALTFIATAPISFGLALYILRSPPGTPEFNAEYGKLHWLAPLVIAVPSIAATMVVFTKLIGGLEQLTGLTQDEIFRTEKK